mgnify:CR=1 FL=1
MDGGGARRLWMLSPAWKRRESTRVQLISVLASIAKTSAPREAGAGAQRKAANLLGQASGGCQNI